MPAWVRMVALSGVLHGAALVQATTQLRSGHDLRLFEPSFLVGADEEKEELTSNFTTTAEAIVVATHVGDIIFVTFFEP